MPRIIDTSNPNYKAYQKVFHPNGSGAHNGAYYYSKEIVENIIPNVETWRPWDTLGIRALHSADHAIVFLHHNKTPEKNYRWLRRYKDLVYVCSSNVTYEWAKGQLNGHAVFLPLSVDVEYVKKFRADKTKEACYAGNRWRFKAKDIAHYVPEGVDFPPKNLPREELFKFVAPYKVCYAIGRSAIEARVLDCCLEVCDSRYPDPGFWQILDNKDAATILQDKLSVL